MVAFSSAAGKDLGFACEAAKGLGVQNAAGITDEGGAVGVSWLRIASLRERIVRITGNGDVRR